LAGLLAVGAGGCNIIMRGGDDDDDDSTAAADASVEGGSPERDPFYVLAGSWEGTWEDGNGTGPLRVTIDDYEAPSFLHFVTVSGVWNANGGSGRAPFEPPVSQHYIGKDGHWHLELALIYDNGCGADLVRGEVKSQNHVDGWYGDDCCGADGRFAMYREGTPRPDGGGLPGIPDASVPQHSDASTDYRRDASSDW
jgi:hypothetical protein